MEVITLREAIEGWGDDDRRNLMSLLGEKHSPSTTREIEEKFKSLFHSHARAVTSSSVSNVASWASSKLSSSNPDYINSNDLMPIPTYNDLLMGLVNI